MKRRFFVAANPLSAEQEKAFITYLEPGSIAWWHWISGSWLVVDIQGQLTAQSIRDQLLKIAPKARTLVLEVTNAGAWASCGPSAPAQDMHDWLHKTWDAP